MEAVAVPLFEVEPVTWEAPEAGAFNGLLLTSANAVRCGGEALQSLRGLKVYAVGEATADAAREAGFDIAATGEAGVDRLLGSIEPDLKLLHLCGSDRYKPGRATQRINRLTVYRATPVEAPDLSAAPGSVALIHSQRAGRRFAELVADRHVISIVAISQAAADALGEGWSTVKTAVQPNDDALLALAESLCDKPDPK
jgi:uroporphyrinogen-III synthase